MSDRTKAFHGYRSQCAVPNDEKPSLVREGTFELRPNLNTKAAEFHYYCGVDGDNLDVHSVRIGSARVFTERQLLDCVEAALNEVGSSMSELFGNIRNTNNEKEA